MGAMARQRGLPAAEVHRQHRDEADRHERDAHVGGGEQRRREREHASRGPSLELEVVAQIAADRQVHQQRPRDAREYVVGDEERGRGGEHDRQLGAGDRSDRERVGQRQHAGGGDDRQQVLRGVEQDLER